MRKTVLTFGAISGAIMAVMFLITMPFEERMGDKAMIVGYASMVAASLLIYFGVRSYRDDVAGGSINFGRAFGVGMLIVAVSGSIYVATWEIVWPRFMPDFYEKYGARELEAAKAKGATPEQIEAQRAQMAKYMEMYRNPVLNAALTFLEPLPVGLIVALLSAWRLSRRRREHVPVPAT